MIVMSWNVNTYINKDNLFYRISIITEEICKISPDILLLQESSVELLDSLTLRGYILCDSILSHGGLCSTMVKPGIIVQKCIKYDTTGIGIKIDNRMIVNCHLVPYKNNIDFRKNQLDEIVKKNINFEKNNKIAFIGDMNMHKNEYYTTELYKEDQQLIDIGLKTGNLMPTWYRNYFHKESNVKNRYDRIFTNMGFCNYKVHSELHGISDHLPLTIVF